jgi:hypothetical protein
MFSILLFKLNPHVKRRQADATGQLLVFAQARNSRQASP